MSTVASQRSDQTLPAGFEDLERFVDAWSLASERERNRQRLSSSMEEIQALYDALLPRMDEVIGYLNQQPLNDMPEDARRLFHLSLALAEIAPAVEFYKQPEVVDGFPPDRFVPVEVPYMTPRE
ncbi:MAG: hypothetical protein H0V18_10820 [Pyrinomonadaceae bacterium]|nr:hypothetical protein [Pyrinomonadaceae bacterium]